MILSYNNKNCLSNNNECYNIEAAAYDIVFWDKTMPIHVKIEFIHWSYNMYTNFHLFPYDCNSQYDQKWTGKYQ